MKRFLGIRVAITALVIGSLITGCGGETSEVNAGAPATSAPTAPTDLVEGFAGLGRGFTPTPLQGRSPAVSSDTAVDRALAEWPGPERSAVATHFGSYSRAGIAQNLPEGVNAGPAVDAPVDVWIVTLPDVVLPISGPVGVEPQEPTPTDLHVIVDATTGEVLEMVSFE